MSIIDPVRTRVDLATLDLGFGTFPNVQPFSPRTAIGYQDLLESLRVYVTRDLYRFLIASSGQATWDSNVDTLLAAIDTALAQQKVDIDTETAAALQAVIDSTIAITDPVTLAIITDPATDTRTLLDTLYQLTDARLATLLGATTSTTRDYLDGRYPRKVASGKNAVTGWFHVDDFGATGDGVTDDHLAIQSAIDTANAAYAATGALQRVFFATKRYIVGRPADMPNPVYGLMLKDGVELYGRGTLVVAPGSYWVGTDYALLRSPVEGLTNAGIRELTFDGNRDAFNVPGTTTQCNTITLRTCNNVKISGVTVLHSAGTALMVAGSSTNLTHELTIQDCLIDTAGNIGIQCSQFDGIKIINNSIAWTDSNAIDIYGEPSSHTGNSTGLNFTVSGNRCRNSNSGVGVFLETVAQGTVQGNRIRDMGQGIHVNRINAQPTEILISGNYIHAVQEGIGISGDTGGITIRDNVIEYFNSAGIRLGYAGNVSQVYILNNTINGNADTIPKILAPANTTQVASIIIRGNITKTRDRTYDFLNYCTNSSGITKAPFISPGDVITS